MSRPARPLQIGCAGFETKLADWLELEAAERRALTVHAAGCPACARELDRWQAMYAVLAASREEYRGLRYPNRELDLPREPAVSGWLPWRRAWLPVAAGLIVAILVALWVGRSPTPQGELAVGRTPATVARPVAEAKPMTEVRAADAAPPLVVEPSIPVGVAVAEASSPPASSLPRSPAPRRSATPSAAPAAGASPASAPPHRQSVSAAAALAALAALGAQARSLPVSSLPRRPTGLSLTMPSRPLPPAAIGAAGGGASA